MLDIISKADMVVGRAGSNREWALLKYVAPMLSQGLYELTRNKGIKYSQYSLPWPLMGPLYARGQTTRKLAAALAPATITSRRTCSAAMLPYLLQILARHEPKVDIERFALENFGDESVAESLVKVLERKLT
jgi:replication factor C large subunit